MEKKQKFLNSVYQNCTVAMQSINDLLDKIQSQGLKQELKSQYKLYENIKSKCEKIAVDKELETKDNNWFEKAKMWTSIQMTTLMDNSTRHIAEMLLLGTVMGLNVCYKDKWDYKDVDDEVEKIRAELEKLEEDCYSSYKKYLQGDIDKEFREKQSNCCEEECNCDDCYCEEDCNCDDCCCEEDLNDCKCDDCECDDYHKSDCFKDK